MTAIRVAVATTEGPAEVQALEPEDAPDVRSVICVDGGSDALPVSRAYDGFVRRPTGVIEARFGHRVWRMDVSAPIGDGESWQLGVYAAHMLHASQQLATDTEPAPWASYVLATGRVDSRLDVRGVEHVRTKLTAAAPRLRALLDAGIHVYLAVPADNAGDVAHSVLRDLGIDNLTVLQCRTADELETALPADGSLGRDRADDGADDRARAQAGHGGHAAPRTRDDETCITVRTDRPHRGRSGRSGMRILGVGLGLLVLLGAAGAWLLRDVPALMAAADRGDYAGLARMLDRDGCAGCSLAALWVTSKQPGAGTIDAAAVALKPRGARTCATATLGGGSYTRKRLSGGPTLPATQPGSVCALTYAAVNRASSAMPMLIAVRNGETVLQKRTAGAIPPGERVQLRVPRAEFPANGGGLTVVVLAGGLGGGDLAAAARVRPALLRPEGGRPETLGIRRTVRRHPFDGPETQAPRFQ